MLTHPDPEVKAIFGVLENQRDVAQEAQAVNAGLVAMLQAKTTALTAANEALTTGMARLQAELAAQSPEPIPQHPDPEPVDTP
jgi:hypothetical protein